MNKLRLRISVFFNFLRENHVLTALLVIATMGAYVKFFVPVELGKLRSDVENKIVAKQESPKFRIPSEN
jgi:hypothetical protein